MPLVPRPVRTDHPQAEPSPIGLNVKSRRKALDITQEELARRAGMEPGHVALIEQGRRKDLKHPTLSKLAQGLECTVDELLTGTTQPPPRITLEEFIRQRKVPKPVAQAMREARQLLGSQPDEALILKLYELVLEKLKRE